MHKRREARGLTSVGKKVCTLCSKKAGTVYLRYLRTVAWARVICTTTLQAGLPGRSTIRSASAATGKRSLVIILSIMPLFPPRIIHVSHACMDVCCATAEQNCDTIKCFSVHQDGTSAESKRFKYSGRLSCHNFDGKSMVVVESLKFDCVSLCSVRFTTSAAPQSCIFDLPKSALSHLLCPGPWRCSGCTSSAVAGGSGPGLAEQSKLLGIWQWLNFALRAARTLTRRGIATSHLAFVHDFDSLVTTVLSPDIRLCYPPPPPLVLTSASCRSPRPTGSSIAPDTCADPFLAHLLNTLFWTLGEHCVAS